MMLPSTDVTYPTFWRQAARWLAASSADPVAVRTRSTGAGQVEATLDVRDENARPVRDAEIQLQIRGADGNLQGAKAVPDRDTDGTYLAEVRVPPGVTRIDATAVSKGALVGRATAWALAGPDENEMVEPRRNDAQLARLAQRFGGRLIAAADINGLIREVSAQRAAGAARIERDLWHHPVVLIALLLLLVSEWGLRRKWGLR